MKIVNGKKFYAEVNDLVSMRLDDMRELLMRNIDIIMSEAKKGRGDYENT